MVECGGCQDCRRVLDPGARVVVVVKGERRGAVLRSTFWGGRDESVLYATVDVDGLGVTLVMYSELEPERRKP